MTNALVLRFSNKGSRILFEDFILIINRLKRLVGKYKEIIGRGRKEVEVMEKEVMLRDNYDDIRERGGERNGVREINDEMERRKRKTDWTS